MKYCHDITHCEGDSCSLKETCYRYMAYLELKDIDINALMFIKPPPKDGKCEFYNKCK